MSDKVKLIIEIPQEIYSDVLTDGVLYIDYVAVIGESIKSGIPLDDVKLKIEQDMCFDMFNDYGNETAIHKELWEILDNIGKPESEDEEW